MKSPIKLAIYFLLRIFKFFSKSHKCFLSFDCPRTVHCSFIVPFPRVGRGNAVYIKHSGTFKAPSVRSLDANKRHIYSYIMPVQIGSCSIPYTFCLLRSAELPFTIYKFVIIFFLDVVC
jgi:hypothetical protein